MDQQRSYVVKRRVRFNGRSYAEGETLEVPATQFAVVASLEAGGVVEAVAAAGEAPPADSVVSRVQAPGTGVEPALNADERKDPATLNEAQQQPGPVPPKAAPRTAPKAAAKTAPRKTARAAAGR